MGRLVLAALLLAAAGTTGCFAGTVEKGSGDAEFEWSSYYIVGRKLEMKSKVLGETRQVWVYTPPNYALAMRKFPTLYVLDGDAHFHHVTSLVDFLSQSGRMPPMIVVGLSNVDRNRDFTPTRAEGMDSSGGADKFLSFMQDELFPYLEDRYRMSEYRVLMGHSFGGLVTVHALLEEPDAFSAYLALSPSLWWDGQITEQQAPAKFARRDADGKFLFFAVGAENKAMRSSNESFSRLLRTNAPSGLDWRYAYLGRDNHFTSAHRGAQLGLESLFEKWPVPPDTRSVRALEEHYAGWGEKLGYEIVLPEGVINQFAYALLRQGDLNHALAAFQRNVELYPHSPNVYDSLGEVLEQAGKFSAAVAAHEQAVQLARRQQHRMLGVFQQRLDEAKRRAQSP